MTATDKDKAPAVPSPQKPDADQQPAVGQDDAFLDEALEESFPASDPPASNRVD